MRRRSNRSYKRRGSYKTKSKRTYYVSRGGIRL